jgi:aryl-alcohol dehydrogenase-like predicted oxidoreductase
MTFIEQLVQSIDTHIEELEGEIAELTRAREELVANGAVRAAGSAEKTPHRAPRAARRRARRSSNDALSVGELHSTLAQSEGGLSTAALSERANADPAQVLPLLREMEARGQVRRTGQRRATRWHAVDSEEEWIAERAAELAARSRG